MQYFAFAREKVILNVEALHGLQMTPQDCSGNHFCNLGGLITALLNVMQSLQTQLQVIFALFIPLRNTRVEVPAVIIKRLALNSLLTECFNLALPFLLEIKEAHNNVPDLGTGVIDIVLHFDMCAGSTEQTNKRVAQDRVAQMSDMRRFVGIDAGVLDENLFTRCRFRPPVFFYYQPP